MEFNMADYEPTISPLSPIPRRPIAFRSYSCQTIDTCDMARRNSSPAALIPSPHEFIDALKRTRSLSQRPPPLVRAFSFSNLFAKKIGRTPSPRNSPLPVSPTTLVYDRADELPELSDGSTSFSDSRPVTPPSPWFSSVDTLNAPHRRTSAEYEIWAQKTKLRQFKLIEDLYRVHSYPTDEVPYPQTYMRTVQQSEYHNFTLLKQLAGGSPTFSKKTFQPKQVLDLGAGVGYWAAFAAETWADCTVTAFDIVNMSYDLDVDPAVMDRIVWIEGNFLDDWEKWETLQDNTFDFVRLAGWELSIPHDKLDKVVRQIKRVLAPNGKVEVVCDAPMYAYAETCLSATQEDRSDKSVSDNSESSFDSDSKDETTPTRPKSSSGSSTSSTRYANSARSSCSSSTEYEDDGTSSPTQREDDDTPCISTWDDDADTLCSKASSRRRAAPQAENRGSHGSPPDLPFKDRLAMSRNVEMWFDTMLRERLGYRAIDEHLGYRPIDVHAAIKRKFVEVFGDGRVVATPPFEIAVPTKETPVEPVWPPIPSTMVRTESYDKVTRPSTLMRSLSHRAQRSYSKSVDYTTDADMRDSSSLLRQAHDNAARPRHSIDHIDGPSPVTSSKAMKILGIPADEPCHYQPQGFVIKPNTFVPCAPEVLEAHACHHMDTIIECRPALKDFVRDLGYSKFTFNDTTCEYTFDEYTFDGIMSEYERFKRRRMNWPLDYPHLKIICEEPVSPTSAIDDSRPWWSKKLANSPTITGASPFLGESAAQPSLSYRLWGSAASSNTSSQTLPSYDDATTIRTIQVFQAIKSGTAVGAGDIYIPTPAADKHLRNVTDITRELTGIAY